MVPPGQSYSTDEPDPHPGGPVPYTSLPEDSGRHVPQLHAFLPPPRRLKLDDPVLAEVDPPSIDSILYESALRSSFSAAQRLQGPLDGSWTLRDADGAKLYRFQISDPGNGGQAEGGWRHLGGTARPVRGVLSSISSDGATVTLRFFEHGPTDPIVVSLTRTASGLTGQLRRDGAAAAVTLTHEPF